MSIEIKISKKRFSYKKAMLFLNKRVDEVKLGRNKELIWILEHPTTFTAGVSYNKKDIIDKRIKIIKTNRGGKITLHNPNQKIIYFVINLNNRKRLLLDDVVKTNETNVASAWLSLESSKGFLNSVKAQVRAAQIANDGIAAEYERGSRTALDVSQSNALLLSAQISLASSEKNYLMAQYNLLKAVGLLNSQYLKLK